MGMKVYEGKKLMIKTSQMTYKRFLVARSDSRRTDFNERDLELRNCRRRRPVSRESSVVSRPFCRFATGEGSRLVLRGLRARSLAFSPFASRVSVMHDA